MTKTYDQLLEKFHKIMLLNSLNSLLYWDLNTGIPSEGVDYRTKQFNWIQTEIHKCWVNDKLEVLVNRLMNNLSLDKIQKRNVELMKREIENRKALPIELVGEIASQSNKTLEIWKIAKRKNQFQDVLPDLIHLFDLNLKRAEFFADVKGFSDPYEALINFRDPGFTVDKITQLFDEVKSYLVPLIKKVQNASKQPDSSFLNQKFDRSVQVKLLIDLAKFLEYQPQFGRIDEVEHPLTIRCGPKDVRVTVKYHEDQIMRAFSSCTHEIGHALYRLQQKQEWEFQPISNFSSPSFGESQSRFLENMIGLSEEFWKYYYTRFQRLTEKKFDDIEMNEFFFAINRVKPGFLRIDSDELTYCLHVIIRFEIERDLFANKIDFKDLPIIWNEKYHDYLGVNVPSDTLGVMQDLHWYSQYWGYFHGYAIGDIISAQITTQALTRDIPNWRLLLEKGEFATIREWLAKNVHCKGCIADAQELTEMITGKPLSVKCFTNYLQNKYSKLYVL